MYQGSRSDGSDAFADSVSSVAIQLSAAIAIAKNKSKDIGSTDGMTHTAKTSPYHSAWLDRVDRDLVEVEQALGAGDFERIAEIVEGSCLAMHADAMAARPGILYFGPSTLWAIARVRELRQQGVPVFFTIDAGPHLVAFCEPSALVRVYSALREHPEIETVYTSVIGGPAEIVSEAR